MGTPYLLALDLGIASIGWALLGLDDSGNPNRVIRTGSHLYDSSNPADFEKGKDEPAAKPRRDARQLRKMIWRRARRKRKLLRQLQLAKLLPAGNVSTPMAIDVYVKSIDALLAESWNKDITHREHQLLPYRIRAAGLDRDLSPVEFGRALYHLAQRRGFLSNRKSKEKADEKSVVKSGISELAQEMAQAKSRTLGEYFSSIDPEQIRLRRRWTHRSMFEAEFDRLWLCQAGPLGLNEQQRNDIRGAIFHQRPLKSSDHLIGRCRHIPSQRRAPIVCRLFQRFRMLQKVNDLRLVNKLGDTRPLSAEQRDTVLSHLATSQSVKLTEVTKAIAAPKGFKLNFERDEDTTIPGHKTDCRLAAIIPGYTNWSDAQKTVFVDELLGSLDDAALRDRMKQAYKLDAETVANVIESAGLEDDYAGVSRESMRRLLPRMERGESYVLVARDVFPEEFKPAKPLDRLPPILKHNPDLRNPTVLRGLSEVRKLVNLVIKRFGKPERIHIELLRELKKSREARADIAKKNDARQKLREKAAAEVVKEAKVARASARDIEKWLLAEECGWECPYTGKSINAHSLFREPQFEIEHIWPYAQSLDDSFANKTLCHLSANRDKGNRLPSTSFSKTSLDEIVGRVAHFKGDLRDEKLRRFKATEVPEGFTNRQFNDSSHLARAASQYLGLLYGGVSDGSGVKRIHTRVGGLTAQLRRLWGLNQILSGDDRKTRDDHRHHAIDAVVVGCADTRTVADMMRVASEQIAFGRSRISDLPLPWPSFFHELASHIEQIVVSHRQSRKIGGALHGGTNYSRAKQLNGDVDSKRTIRKPVTSLKETDFAKIVDIRIRNAVEAAFAASDANSPDKAFAERKFPQWIDKAGRSLPIKCVTLESDAKPKTIGKNERTRYVDSTQGSNHHARIIAKLAPDPTDPTKVVEKSWHDGIVTRFDMYQPKSDGKLSVNTAVSENERFKFSLAANEYVEVDDLDADGKVVGRMLCRVLSVSKGDFELVYHLDGRTAKERKDQKARMRGGAAWLKERKASKKFVNYLGEVKNAGG